MNRKHILFLAALLLAVVCVQAQGDFKSMASVVNFKTALARQSQDLNSLETDFTQVKFMEMLSEKITSQGKFYYKKDKIRLDYTTPVKYLIVINGQKIKIVSDGKKNVYDLKANKMMSQVQSLMAACMTGNLDLLSGDYQIEYRENATHYWVCVKPKGEIKSYLKEIDIYLNKKDLSVDRLKMTESSGDYIEYVFSNKKKNTPIADEKFSLN